MSLTPEQLTFFVEGDVRDAISGNYCYLRFSGRHHREMALKASELLRAEQKRTKVLHFDGASEVGIL